MGLFFLEKIVDQKIFPIYKVHIHTCYPNVHLGRFVVHQHVVEGCNGIEEDGVDRRCKQADKVGDAPTIIDGQ